MTLIKRSWLVLIIIFMSQFFLVTAIHAQDRDNQMHVDLKQDVQLKQGDDTISGKIIAPNSNDMRPYQLVIKNNRETLLKKTIQLNRSFSAELKRHIQSRDQLTMQLQSQTGQIVVGATSIKLSNWRVLNKPKTKIQTTNWGNVFQNSRSAIKKYRVTSAPDTGLSYLKKPNYIKSHRNVTTFKENDRSVNNEVKQYQTALLLPTISTKLVNWQLPQGSALNGRYLYVMYESQQHKNRGRIVRYDIEQLKALDIWQNGGDDLRQLEKKVNDHHIATTADERLLQTITVGPEFKMGHGQAVSFNAQDNKLWFVSLKKHSRQQRLMQVDLQTLYPSNRYKFVFKDKQTQQSFHGEQNLSIDKVGNIGIVGMISDKTKQNLKAKNVHAGDLMMYHGHMVNGKLQMKVSNTVVRQKPGYFGQFLSINNQNQQLAYLTDGAYYGIPAAKWANGTLKNEDISSAVYTKSYNTREFESQVWDEQGHSYLIINRGAEIMQGVK